MEISDKDYELVENILLNNKSEFNTLQREFIELFENKTIIAGPGAGKTTSLAAKIVILLKNLNSSGSRAGVCIITHTNVAVNEINNALIKAGIGKIDHPHFIGTINEFFNRFCVLPLFKYTCNHNNLVFDKEHPNDLEFYKSFLSVERSFMSEDVKGKIAFRMHNSNLIFNINDKCLDISNTTNWHLFEKYKDLLLEAKLTRKSQGFLTHDDTFLFSTYFLQNLKFKEIIRNRFKYIFLDEFQDTPPEGKVLLDELFKTQNNIYQLIGDPYQTISFDHPMPSINESEVFRINITNRFGNQITEHLNTILPQSQMKSISGKESLSPIILLYKNEEDIYPAYQAIIKEYEEINFSFRENNKKDKVLVLVKTWSNRIKKGVNYKEKNLKKNKSINSELKTLVIEFVVGKLATNGEKISTINNWISKHPKILSLHTLLINIIKNGIDDDNKIQLCKLINQFLTENGVDNIGLDDNIYGNIENIIKNQRMTEVLSDETDDIFTIHSVKGETLRSVLLVDFGRKPFTKVLLHKYGIIDDDSYRYTDQNLLYVAMSRVTDLFVFAMAENVWTTEIAEVFQKNWAIKRV